MNYVLWRRVAPGRYTPSLTVLIGHNRLNEYDRKNKVCDPIELPPVHENLSIEELIKLYPCPPQKDPLE